MKLVVTCYLATTVAFVGANVNSGVLRFIDAEADPAKGNSRLTKESKRHNAGSNNVVLAANPIGKACSEEQGRDRVAFE